MLIKSKAQKLPPQAEAIFATVWRATPELRLKQRKATHCPNFLQALLYEYTLLNFGVMQADKHTDLLETTLQLLSSSPLMGHTCPEIGDDVRWYDHQRHAIFYRARQ